MLALSVGGGNLRSILCLGAHCDDIEIGCGGTILRLLKEFPALRVTWVVFASDEVRAREASISAEAFLDNAGKKTVKIEFFRNGFFPYIGSDIKAYFEKLKSVRPDLILTHFREDRHQDHRLISELTWNTFRDHFIIEYEIPKYDGDMSSPNLYVPLPRDLCEQKIDSIYDAFVSQRGRQWFTKETFWAMLRLRGIESNSASGYAEGFYAHKCVL